MLLSLVLLARLSLEEERDTLSAQCVRSRAKVVELQGLYQNAKEGGVFGALRMGTTTGMTS